MDRSSEFYRLLGYITVSFSGVEFFIARITEVMLELGTDTGVARYVCSQWQLDKRVRALRELALLRLCHLPTVLKEVEDMLNAVNNLRPFRNSLIHGQWVVNPDLLNQGKAQCWNVTWKVKRQTDGISWQFDDLDEYTFADLEKKEQEISACRIRLMQFYTGLFSMELMTPSGPRRPRSGIASAVVSNP
jgi:hypothetical protein